MRSASKLVLHFLMQIRARRSEDGQQLTISSSDVWLLNAKALNSSSESESASLRRSETCLNIS